MARHLLREGEIVAFPTDTVYGIGCSITSERAIERIFLLKNRPKDRPLQVLVSDLTDITEFTDEVLPIAKRMMAEFWPGGLTILLPARKGLFPRLGGPGNKVGLRVPDLPGLQQKDILLR